MKPYLLFCFALLFSGQVFACKDSVVLVHGNTAEIYSWDNTYHLLLENGYSSEEIYRPDWGLKGCAACNDHSGSEEVPVKEALITAIANSCTGKIDVISHSMGATLAAQQIIKLDAAASVDTFVGIAGAFRGLWTCGVYPFHVWSATCGASGLSVQSPLLSGLYGQVLADKVYSIKSHIDQVVCATGVCTVEGLHSSSVWFEDNSFTFVLGHFGLQTETAGLQLSLIL